eukprot:TRINITY_DN75569_c0_g1_i1.p1 TRINITY_DN75569_c0_g1~~TRINITY_DN75569_c0_g1_i1.p1  ORF type:complete len:127 (+),score=23.44 TRINITY_DN75569_c0_g1_i1:302-682(+)
MHMAERIKFVEAQLEADMSTKGLAEKVQNMQSLLTASTMELKEEVKSLGDTAEECDIRFRQHVASVDAFMQCWCEDPEVQEPVYDRHDSMAEMIHSSRLGDDRNDGEQDCQPMAKTMRREGRGRQS